MWQNSFVWSQKCPSKCQCTTKNNIDKWQCGGNGVTTNDLETFSNFGNPGIVGTLELKRNNITVFPMEKFIAFKKLTKLDLGNNKISSLPKNISGYFPVLETLKMNGNGLKTISTDELAGYDNIKTLDIYDNEFTEIPPNTFKQLKNLDNLLLESNKISKLYPTSLSGLDKLTSLALKGNQITKLPFGIFNDTKNLKKIWLDRNPLEMIEANVFLTMPKLERLYLGNTTLTDEKIKANAFKGLEVDILDLKNNNLTTLKKEWFSSSSIGSYETNLEGNRINCDCHFYETYDAWKSEEPFFTGVCAAPSAVANQNIIDVMENNNLKCDSCSLNTCQNNATCKVVNATDYECQCSVFYHGTYCELPNLCVDDPCQFNATCQNHNSSHFTCDCAPGYVGDVCSNNEPCFFSNPCQHNSTCQALDGAVEESQYTCNCTQGYIGKNCDVERPCYHNNPCLHNGTCRYTGGFEYSCNCTDGYKGKNCQDIIKRSDKDGLNPGWIILIILICLAVVAIIVVFVYKRRVNSTESKDLVDGGESMPLKGNIPT